MGDCSGFLPLTASAGVRRFRFCGGLITFARALLNMGHKKKDTFVRCPLALTQRGEPCQSSALWDWVRLLLMQ